MFTLTTLLFCAIFAPAINAPNGNYPEIPSTVHRVKNTGQVRTKRQYWEATADRQNSKNVNREKQNEQHNNNEQISVSYIYYDGSAQNYKPPPPPPRHWGKQDYYPRPPPPPHDGRYPRRPGSPHQYEADHRRPDFSHDNRDDRPWPPPPPPDRRRSFDHGPPPPHHGPPPPDRHRSFDHGSLPPPHRDHGPPHHDRGPPPPWNRGPPRRGPPPPWYSGPPHRGPPRHGPPPPPHYSPPYFDRKPPHSTHYNEKQPFKDKRPPNDGPPPDRIPSLNENNSPSSAYNTQTGSSNDQNEDFIKNLKLVFSNEFKTTFLKNRQVISENNNEKATTINTPDPGYKQGQGEPLANLEYSTVSVHTTPPSLSHLFQVVPVTPAS